MACSMPEPVSHPLGGMLMGSGLWRSEATQYVGAAKVVWSSCLKHYLGCSSKLAS